MSYEIRHLPPSYICEYGDGCRIHTGEAPGRGPVGMACGGVVLIMAALSAWHRASRIATKELQAAENSPRAGLDPQDTP
ncbi:hypothetical protein GCM10011374_32000 [Kocuria dechangensis]|uniref:Uncharacterized protein n=1 Tax=Kocuria dechangensis TaxID=1176249 RepID=A0A917H348_9MICC|nr:hypothetical protein GCM10011374_32000 [Kocuria dechangensis]